MLQVQLIVHQRLKDACNQFASPCLCYNFVDVALLLPEIRIIIVVQIFLFGRILALNRALLV